MEIIKNKYGMLVYEFKPGERDMSVTVYDENNNLIIGRDACRKKLKEIMAEERSREELIDDDIKDAAQDIFIEPNYLTMTNEEVNEVIERCQRRVVEEYGCTDL
jgi:hypothetical protein